MDAAQLEGPPNLCLFDLKPHQRFQNVVVALVDKRLRQGQNGAPYLTVKVRDSTDTRNGKWFNPPQDVEDRLDGAVLISISGSVDGSPNYMGDLKLTQAEPAEVPDDVSAFLPPLPGDHRAHLKRFADLVRSVQNPHLGPLLRTIFQGDFWNRFAEAPAAKNMHHAYRGGLMEHSGEVALLCDRCASTLPHIDRDLLVTAALLHDIGKLEEMESDLRAGEYTHAGQLVGHIVLGTCTVANAADALPDFPPRLKHELMHLILSHHGRPEHGAAKIPMCAEAVILSQCDLMSARVAQCNSLVSNPEGKDDFPKAFGWEVPSIYVGSTRAQMQATALARNTEQSAPVNGSAPAETSA